MALCRRNNLNFQSYVGGKCVILVFFFFSLLFVMVYIPNLSHSSFVRVLFIFLNLSIGGWMFLDCLPISLFVKISSLPLALNEKQKRLLHLQ